jgi:CBS domain-containing protein
VTLAPRATAPVAERMTPAPLVLDCHRSVAEAREAMFALGVEHLPVTDRGELCGLASARDLDRLQLDKPNVDPEVLEVGQAMSPRPLTVAPATPLLRVVERMAEEGLDAAVVVDGREVVGIFTARDALRLLLSLLASPAPA